MANQAAYLDVASPLRRRTFLQRTAAGIGMAALADICQAAPPAAKSGLAALPHIPPQAKRVIFLHQSGAPSQLDLFDPKPETKRRHGTELPESIRQGQRLTTMTAEQKSKPITNSLFSFQQYGNSATWLSELLPHTRKIVDDACFIHSLHTEAINHDPGITFMQTGSEQPGRPSMGAWTSYGLGSENANLPAFIVFISGGDPGDQPLYGRLWSSGFLPASHQGVKFRSGPDAVHFLSNPAGIDARTRERMVAASRQLNQLHLNRLGDPRIQARIEQAEMAHAMQMSVPSVTDLSDEPASTFELYGEQAKVPGSFAANCLMARRLAERNVRFIQLYHRGWDHHTNLPARIRNKCEQTDRASAALVLDLKQRGLLDETLVVWAGEFGRTVYCQGELTKDNYGRDHHPRCFSIWMAGGGVKPGFHYGKTDDFSYSVVENPVHVHDLQATILHLMGIDHERLTFRFRGRDYRLTDIAGNVVHDILT